MSDIQANRDSFLKRTEYFIKKIFDKYLINSVTPILISKPENHFSFNSNSKILILRNDRIGDLLISVPFLRILKEKNPQVNIDALISENNKSAKSGYEPYINRFYIYQKNIIYLIKLIYQLRKINYDLVIDLFDNPSTTNAFMIKMIKPIHSLGIRKLITNIYSFEVPLLNKNQNHIVDRVAQLLLPFGINPQNENLSLGYNLNENELYEAEKLLCKKTRKYRFGINLSGSSRAKYWGIFNFKKLMELVNEKYLSFEIVIFTTPEYKSDALNLTLNSNSKIAPFVTNFNLYAAMLSTCDIILTPDTSSVHLASAFNIPCIGLYIWSGLEEFGLPWTPYKTSYRCLTSNDNFLASIDSKDVFTAFEELVIYNNLVD
jgi:ADP-heptose:LPS heptosyltransferase